ncbi:hypothetical protein BS47DRAFT_1378486 [Hydnum rufescens UP504]|uniref:Uncharacterized protein n=1 Tax=Hydnum rufescens UP504 TaxID=1448309 RepID=A0A9P6BB31_9AGAM|nr:hypothetical protein BS47DRAFT_1378486 [Hydnum rufescens UP504]
MRVKMCATFALSVLFLPPVLGQNNNATNRCTVSEPPLYFKIGWWTLDNASNNNTFMVELEKHVLALLKTAPEGDIMARLHGLVNAIRTSSDRRVAFLDTVRQGNASKLFQPPVPEVECFERSRQGGTRHMAIEAMMIQKKYREIRSKNLTDEQWTMAQKILDILDYPHLFQHLMTGEATPTLSSALPAFQCLQDRWEDHAGNTLTWQNTY